MDGHTMQRFASYRIEKLAQRLGVAWLAFVVGLSSAMPALSIDAQRTVAGQIPIRNVVPAPPGAASICRSYDWACARSGEIRMLGEETLQVIRRVNAHTNRTVRPITDMQQYRLEERWSLPTARGGDCEDYALYKKRELIRAGVPPEQLLLAAVLDRKRQFHAVLIVRTGTQDLVLDNLTNRIVPWHKTGYTILRVQDPRQPTRWVSVYAGGAFPLS